MSAPPFRLLAITPPEGRVTADVVAAWGDPEVGVGVLLREIERPLAALDPNGRLAAVAAAARGRGHAVLWSAPADVVLARPWSSAGLDGVQLRGDPDPEACLAVRRHVGPSAIVGRSVHGTPTPSGGSKPQHPQPGPNYTVFAPVFDPRTTSVGGPTKKAAGTDVLRAWAETTEHVFALGGVAPDNAAACVSAGAWGLASIRACFAPDASAQVAALARALR